jgi:hypothetical protein
MAPGLALCVTAPHETLSLVPRPLRPVLEHVSWSEQTEINPLQATLDDTERVMVAHNICWPRSVVRPSYFRMEGIEQSDLE